MLDRRISATIALATACIVGSLVFGIIKVNIEPQSPLRPTMGKTDIANCEINTGTVNDESKYSLMMDYSNDFFVVFDNNPTRYKISATENQILMPFDRKQELKDWYLRFHGTLMDRYRPIARGSMMTDARIGRGGVETVVFSNYKYAINYHRPEGKPKPPAQAPSNNLRKLKAGIVRALKDAVLDSTLVLPSGVKSVEVNFTLAGDPEGGSGGAWVFP